MTTDTWIAISAGATFLLAGAAAWSIWQNRITLQTERKIKLLNEINDWETAISECETKVYLPINLKLNIDLVIDNLNKMTFLEYRNLVNRGEYIEAIADKFFHADLYNLVHNIILKLNGVMYIRGKIIDIVDEYEEESLFNFGEYKREFTTVEEVVLVGEIEKELSFGKKDIAELCDEYETSLNDLLSILVIKIVEAKKKLVK